MDVDLVHLDDLAEALVAGGVRSAATDPTDLNLPAVWVKLVGIDFDLLAGYSLDVVLHLVVADNGLDRSAKALVELLNQVTAVIDPTDKVVPRGCVLPGSTAALPGLAVPFTLHVTPGDTP